MPYYVYILTNASHTVLYIGITNGLKRRIHEHKTGLHPGIQREQAGVLGAVRRCKSRHRPGKAA
ncbi:GIY-YIG nuclease family protein [Hymenobacter cellulosilyticus]|uniref:GIY-YIG nuclease family protein n=1 Tax=Hymenobacter cellulosilyticus TaxID=2932248 RepID=UPI00288016D8|nr:GIY-YIG nuclease family protein [Hymenobacter cellulosilyticus]